MRRKESKRLLGYAKAEWPSLVALGVLTCLGSILVALQPWPVKILLDTVVHKAPAPGFLQPLYPLFALPETVGSIVVIAAGASLVLFLFQSLLTTALSWGWSVAGQRMVAHLTRDIFDHVQRSCLSARRQLGTGDILSRLTTDAWCVYRLADGLLVTPLQKVFTLLTLGVIAWRLNPKLAVCLLMTAPLMAAATLFFGRRIKEQARSGKDAQAHLANFVHETISSIPIVQVFGSEGRNWDRYHLLARRATSYLQRAACLTNAYAFASGFITVLGSSVVIFLGAREVLAGRLSTGSLLVFIAYLRSLQASAEQLLNLYGTLKPVEASMERVLELFELPTESAALLPSDRTATPRPRRVTPAVAFEHVRFGYFAHRPVLNGIDLQIRPGETVALIGRSGAGKSTLAYLLLRLFDVWDGRVTLDGRDARDIPLAELRAGISVVFQDPFLLPRSIAENIAYGRPDASAEEVRAAARATNAEAFILRLPDGYNTIVGERGSTLSGGERQRIAIARAFLKNSPLVVLDEPTSALDADSEASVLQGLDRLRDGRTTLLIAHRRSTLRSADRVVALEGGKIVEGVDWNAPPGEGFFGSQSTPHVMPVSQTAAV